MSRSRLRPVVENDSARETARAEAMATPTNTAASETTKVTDMEVPRSDLDVHDALHGDIADDLQDARSKDHADAKRIGEQQADMFGCNHEHDCGQHDRQRSQHPSSDAAVCAQHSNLSFQFEAL